VIHQCRGERVSRAELHPRFRNPILEVPAPCRGIEPFHAAIFAEQQSREMSAICVTQAARGVVIFREEERGESAVWRNCRKRAGSPSARALRLIQAMAHWLRRLACKLAIKRAAAIPFPEMSAMTSPRRALPRSRKS